MSSANTGLFPVKLAVTLFQLAKYQHYHHRHHRFSPFRHIRPSALCLSFYRRFWRRLKFSPADTQVMEEIA